MKKCLLLFLILFYAINIALSQSKDAYSTIDLSIYDESMIEVLYRLEKEYKVKFKFDPNEIPYYKFNKTYQNTEIYKIVEDFCSGSAIRSIIYDPETIVFVQHQFFSREKVLEIIDRWDKGEYKYPLNSEVKLIEISSNVPTEIEESITFTLEILDEENKLPLIGATLRDDSYTNIYAADFNGIIKAQLSPGEYSFYLEYLGYPTQKISLQIYEDYFYKLIMTKSALIIDEIQITAKNERADIEETKVGVASLSTQQLEAIPQVTGEVDIIKSLEILPGVTSAGDLSSGFNVRGGRIDESLVLFNDAIVFNPTHIVGFISAFNADVINQADLYKGYIDPEFGNRSSAVLDIQGGFGNTQKTRIRAGVGTSMMKVTADGPLSKKLTYMVSGRASYSDYLLNATGVPELRKSDASFYDLYGAFRWKLAAKHQLKMSVYASNDVFQYNEEFGFNWKNEFVSADLFSQWTQSLSSSLSFSSGLYRNNQYTLNNSNSYSFKNGIVYQKANLSISKNLFSASSIKVGIEGINYNPDEESLTPNGEGSTVLPESLSRNGSLSISPYISTKWNFSKAIDLEGGIRYSNYYATGPATQFNYISTTDNPFFLENTEEISNGTSYSHYNFLEPRISLNVVVLPSLSLKAGAGRIPQNAQILSLGNTSIPTDLWIFPNNNIKPRAVNQFTIGAYSFLEKYKLNTSLAFFYKQTDNFFVLKDFPTLIGNPHIETELLPAEQNSKGVEFQLEKKAKKWDMLIAYTFSKTIFRSESNFGSVNLGDWYPGDIDIPHQLNFLFSYQLVPTIKFNSSYIYKSGRPITVPAGVVKVDEILIPFYDNRNSGRIPSYSRLDVSFSLDLRKIRKKGLRNSFNIGFYNLLYNKNAFNVFFRTSEIGKVDAYKFSVIGSMVPSISWNCIIN